MRFIQSNVKEITPDNIKAWLYDFNNDIKPELDKLDNYYKAQDIIDKGKQRKEDRPDNNIHVNLAKMIVRNSTSYFVGKPVTYSFEENFKAKDTLEKVLYDNSEEQENKSLAKDLSKFGVAYELIGKGDDGLLYIKNLEPLTTFQVVDDSILQRPICIVTYIDTKKNGNLVRRKGWVYDKYSITEFIVDTNNTKINIVSSEVNPFSPKIPVTVFKNNDDMTGDYEDVLELLNAYSRLISNNFDDIEGILNAVLVFYNTEIDEEDGKKMNKSRVIKLLSAEEGKDPKVEFLTKKLDSISCKELRQALRDDIFTITNVPDFTDEKFAGNQSGVALSYKLIGFENLRLDKESYFRTALENRLELILSYQQFSDIILDKGQIVIQFYANLPANIEKDIKIAELHTVGAISQETMVENLEIIGDKKEELKRLQAEKPLLEDMDDNEPEKKAA